MAEPKPEGDGLRLLSLDGGGIRGLSELLILREIMSRIQHLEKFESLPLPCEYFDIIGGTSTGGLIALMLGRLRMSVDEAIEHYGLLSEQVFSKVKSTGDGKFMASKLEQVIKKIVCDVTQDTETRMLDLRPEHEVCRTFVCAMPAANMTAAIPRLFRTYRVPKNESFDCTIWEAARATTAAPTFFKGIEIGGAGWKERFIDGAFGRNNPIGQVFEEAELVFPNGRVACAISIGTGQAQTIAIPKPGLFQRILPSDVVNAIVKIATHCERTAEETERRFKPSPNIYFRLNVEQGMQNITLAQWDRLGEVATHTNQYLLKAEVDQKLEAAVKAIRERRGVIATTQLVGAITMPPSATLRPRLKTCPPPTIDFTGRAGILSQLDEYFCASPTSFDLGKQRVFVLYGLGGAGKSQIAFKFVKQCQVPQPTRFWKVLVVDGSTAGTITSDLEAIARAEGIGETSKDALLWLSGNREEWLLLLDNADDTEINLREFFPTCYHGNILITSRNPETCDHAPRSNHKVADMEHHDAIDLLLTVARQQPTDEAQNLAVPIIQELGYLALAIVQAGAYISKSCSLARYLQIYKKLRAELLEHHHIQKTSDYKWTAYTTWQISFEKLSSQAMTFLQLCAFLHHKGISEEIFQNAAARIAMGDNPNDPKKSTGVVVDFLAEFTTLDGGWNELRFLAVINEIHSYSLINLDEANRAFSIHPLVHSWAHTTLTDREGTRGCTMHILSLSITHESKAEDLAFRRTLLPHIDEACANSNVQSDFAKSFAQVYSEGGRWKEAEKLQLAVMDMMKRVHSEEHPDTLTSIGNLASTYQQQGRWQLAEELQVMVMETRKRVLGLENLDTLKSIANLASTYQHKGWLKEAEELQVVVMETRKRVLGEEHYDTLEVISDLALTYHHQGRWKNAEGLQVMVLEVVKRMLGNEHPDTLLCTQNLAMTYRALGQLKEAEELQVMVVEANKRVLGEEHPHTLIGISLLSVIYWQWGQWKKAEELQVMVVETRKRVLCEEHPDTLQSIANLASTYQKLGQLKEAEELEVMVMEKMKGVFGEEHQSTLFRIGSLALTYREQGQWKKAEELQVMVMETSKRVLGEEHPDTLRSIGNLASTYQKQGQLKKAEELQVMVMEKMKRVFGEEHQSTLFRIGSLALTYQKQSQLKEAEELQVMVMETRKRVLGEKHPHTLTSISNLAMTFLKQGRLTEAEELEEMVMETRKRVLGEEHPDTVNSIGNLVSIYQDQGRWKEAEKLEMEMVEMRQSVLGEEHCQKGLENN